MGQFTLNGRIYEEMPGGKARVVGLAPAATPATPGALGVVPPNPAMVAQKQAEAERQAAAEGRANEAERRANAAAAREAAAWSASHNPDGSPKVQAPSLLGDPSKTGPAYLATLPQNIRNRVQQLIDGRSLLTAREKGQPLGQQLMDAANQADPTFDENVMHARYVERQQYTGQGKGSQTVQAAERIAQHVNDLYGASKALGGPDLGWAPLSNAATATTNSFRQAKVASYNQILPLISGELQKLTKNGSATVDESNKIEHNLRADQPEAVRYAAMKELVRLGRAQYDPLRESWASAWQGSTPPPMPMDFSKATTAIFDNIEAAGPPLELKRDKNGSLLAIGADGTDASGPPSAPPTIRPSGPSGGVPTADYSGMVGGPGAKLAAGKDGRAQDQTYRTVYDPVGAGALSAFIKQGKPYETAAAYAQSHGFNAPDPKDYAAAVTFAANHGGATNVEADRNVPTTLGERLASSPLAAGIAAGTSAGTAGIADTLGRTIAGPGWDANRAALAATNPGADLAGNIAGGVAGAMIAPELAGRFLPGNLAGRAASLAESNPLAARLISNGAYGGAYGANENPDDPLKGGLYGAATGAIAGEVGQKVGGGLANIIAPPEGVFGPAYAAGAFPTIGQRFGQSGFVGRALNTAEQAMQSFPGLGAMVARARDIPRDAAQIGAFNNALGDLKPFAAAGHDVPDVLPPGTAPGTAPHAFTADAFNKAYPIARSGMQLVPTKEANDAATAFNEKWKPLLSSEQNNQLQTLINSSVLTRLKNGGGMMNGQAYQQAASDIGDAAHLWGKESPLLGQAASEYGSILDNAARASSDPQAVALLDAADKGYAKYAGVIRPASARVGGDPGEFTMKAFDRSVQKNASGPNGSQYLRGTALMQPYADAIRPLGDVLSNSGTGERLMTNRLFMGEQGAAGVGGLGLGLGGAVMAHPGALAPFLPYAPGANALFTRAIAPRQYTLPPAFADALNLAGSKVNDAAPLIGKAAVPGALAYYGLAQ